MTRLKAARGIAALLATLTVATKAAMWLAVYTGNPGYTPLFIACAVYGVAFAAVPVILVVVR